VGEDLRDRGLGQDAVEAEFGSESRPGGEAMDLEAEPGCGRVAHERPPCGSWGPEHPHDPASEVSFHSRGGRAEGGNGVPVLSIPGPRLGTPLVSRTSALKPCHSCPILLKAGMFSLG